MDKHIKAAIKEMIGSSADGVGVAQAEAGGNIEVAFGYNAGLVSKIRAVHGATFADGMWSVPEESAAQLVDVVADMRDFVRNNGVQSKTMENGDVHVTVDYSKEATEAMRKVDRAGFDKDAGAWVVPAASKSLADPLPEFTVSLDKTVNALRGMAIEAVQDMDNIKDLAAATAQSLGMKPGIHFPEKDHSYTGSIVNVNGGYAAQKTNEKDGTVFIAIHKLSDLGKAVFKGDSLRIDYDDKRQANVRTTEVFQQQQKEREQLTALAGTKMDNANVRNASMQDGVKHVGSVIEVTDHFVLQHGGKNEFKIHSREALNVSGLAENIAKGQSLEIAYKGGKGMVVDRNQQKEREGMAR